MRRLVSCSLSADVLAPARAELLVAVAGRGQDEHLRITLDGQVLAPDELRTDSGGRLHVVELPAGRLEVDYRSTVDDDLVVGAPPPLDRSTYSRPSRYAESDRLAGFAAGQFPSLDPAELLVQVPAWVHRRLVYVSGSSRGTDGAADTLLAGAGVCRDFAHLTVALLRARDVPARVASAYAPGLAPMDFHLVVEALVDGAWHVVDPTGLAPRSSLARIATGRDAADTAFLSSYGGELRLDALEVSAVVDGELPRDDGTERVQLA